MSDDNRSNGALVPAGHEIGSKQWKWPPAYQRLSHRLVRLAARIAVTAEKSDDPALQIQALTALTRFQMVLVTVQGKIGQELANTDRPGGAIDAYRKQLADAEGMDGAGPDGEPGAIDDAGFFAFTHDDGDGDTLEPDELGAE